MPASDSLDGSGGVTDHYIRDVVVPPGRSAESVFQLLGEQLVAYDIFPSRIIRATVCSDDGRVHEGTTIVQQFRVGPFRVEAAVRVVRTWHERSDVTEEVGFAYVTLEGHPERGVETFLLQRTADRVTFTIDARSGPGTLLTRLARPVARLAQRRATSAAMERFTTLPRSLADRTGS